MSPENPARLHGLRRSRVRTEKSTYISYIYVLYLAQVSKYLQTLALGIIIFMLCLPKTLHGCTVYVGLGSGTEKSTYISYIYVLYLAQVSKYLEVRLEYVCTCSLVLNTKYKYRRYVLIFLFLTLDLARVCRYLLTCASVHGFRET